MAYEIIQLSANAVDIVGQTFNKLTAIAPIGRNSFRDIIWLCICDCGTETTVLSHSIKSGNTKSCGCHRAKVSHNKAIIHGKSKTVEYKSWRSMINRCHNKNDLYFNDYGDRNITVCSKWLYSFPSFLADMGLRPQGKTLDRIDNDGNYTPENCRWATAEQQANNKRNNKYITHNGQTLTHAQWSRLLGGGASTVTQRIYRGWSKKRAVTQPLRNR